MKINIVTTFHAAVIAPTREGQFAAEIQAKSPEGEIIRIWADTFFDPLTAAQALTKALGEVQQ